jgi:flagellar basal-body rod protein FlgG
MIRSLWIAKSGMEAQQTKLDTITNNLANVSTNGYKRSHAVFEDLMYQNLRQSGSATSEQTQLPEGLQLGLGVRTVATSRDFTPGSLQSTGNELDVAIQGQGFFQVQMPDGTTAYSRDGAFRLDPNGQVVTHEGYPVQPGLTIPTNATKVNIAANGIVTVTVPNQTAPQQVGQLQLAQFVNPAGLEPRGQNLFMETAASGNPTTGTPNSNGLGPLAQSFVETSNVSVVEELVSMIQTQRAYELNSKAVSTSDQMLQKLSQL